MGESLSPDLLVEDRASDAEESILAADHTAGYSGCMRGSNLLMLYSEMKNQSRILPALPGGLMTTPGCVTVLFRLQKK